MCQSTICVCVIDACLLRWELVMEFQSRASACVLHRRLVVCQPQLGPRSCCKRERGHLGQTPRQCREQRPRERRERWGCLWICRSQTPEAGGHGITKLVFLGQWESGGKGVCDFQAACRSHLRPSTFPPGLVPACDTRPAEAPFPT